MAPIRARAWAVVHGQTWLRLLSAKGTRHRAWLMKRLRAALWSILLSADSAFPIRSRPVSLQLDVQLMLLRWAIAWTLQLPLSTDFELAGMGLPPLGPMLQHAMLCRNYTRLSM